MSHWVTLVSCRMMCNGTMVISILIITFGHVTTNSVVEFWELIVLQMLKIIRVVLMISLRVVRWSMWSMFEWLHHGCIQAWLLKLNLFAIFSTIAIVILITFITVVCLVRAKLLLSECSELLPCTTLRTSAGLSCILLWL